MGNNLEKGRQNSRMIDSVKTDDLLKDMCGIIESSRDAAYRAVNTALVQRNWLLGYRIASEEMQGEERAEFLGFSQNTDFTENDLEKSILSNLQKFLMEFGKGYAFVGRQQHIHTEKQDYYIDLVFYNYILKCFVLIDLKTEKISHQEELKAEIETQKAMFYLQQQENKEELKAF